MLWRVLSFDLTIKLIFAACFTLRGLDAHIVSGRQDWPSDPKINALCCG